MTDPLRPPDTDDEPWAVPDDELAPARGCLLGIVIGGLAWLSVIALVVLVRLYR